MVFRYSCSNSVLVSDNGKNLWDIIFLCGLFFYFHAKISCVNGMFYSVLLIMNSTRAPEYVKVKKKKKYYDM